MVTASDKAAEKLRDELIRKLFDTGVGYRIIHNTSTPGSNTLVIELDKECPSDEVTVSHGIRILIDRRDAALLSDYELDYVDGPTGGFYLKSEKG